MKTYETGQQLVIKQNLVSICAKDEIFVAVKIFPSLNSTPIA